MPNMRSFLMFSIWLVVLAFPPPSWGETPGDFYGNGNADILFQNVGLNAVWIWQTNGTVVTGGGDVGTLEQGWQIVGTGDVNGAGRADIILQNVNTGEVWVWLMNGNTAIGGGAVGTAPPGWQVMAIGDVTGAGRADIILQNVNTGEVWVWLMNGNTVIGGGTPGTAPAGWQVVGTGQFNGNGMAGIVLQNVSTGQVWIWQMNGTAVIGGGGVSTPAPGWKVVGTGQFNGSGTAGIVLQNADTGQVWIWEMNGAEVIGGGSVGTLPPGWYIMGTGDVNGDGYTDLILQNAGTGAVWVWLMNGNIVIGRGDIGTPDAPGWQVMGTGQLRGISITADVSANWQMAGMLSVGGIPNRTTVCATLNPSGADDTSAIQAAITACPAGEVVSLSAGTFTVGEGNFILLNKGVTLRGAGPGSTIVQRTNGCPPLSPSSNGNCGNNPSPFIIVGPEQYNNWMTSTNLTADAAQGTYSIQVSSTSGFSVGQIVLLDELSGASYQPDVGVGGSSQIWAAPDYRVVWQKHNPSQEYDDFSSSQEPTQQNTAGCWFATGAEPSGSSRCDRTTSEFKRISAITGNTITFDSPVMISYRASHTAQLSYNVMPFVQNAGVEDLTLQGADDQALQFNNAAYSWAYRVECTQWMGHGCIALDSSFRVQVDTFYVHDGAWPEPGGGGYALEQSAGSAENLFVNGISVRTDKVIVSLASGAGTVVAYNYMDQEFICCDSTNPANGSDGWIENGLNNSHYPGGHHALFEGNLVAQMGEDETHGNSIYNTYFRNWSQGYRIPAWVNAFDGATINDLTGSPQGINNVGPLTPAETQLYTYWETFMGNVLGYPGYSTSANGWAYSTPGGPAIFSLGAGYTSGNNGPDPEAGFDTKGGTTIAHGNYDYLTNTVTWDPYISSQTLPNSMYLNSEPAFFSAGSGYTWPWINPTATPQVYQNCAGGSSYCLPAKARFDAGTPFTQP
jgi:FG-GAP repeat